MVMWIESQETHLIVLIVFGLWFLTSAMIFIVVVLLHKRDPAGHMKATSPVMLTPLSVIVGLLIAFLAARVWSNLDHASTYVGEEATTLRQSVLMADNLPKDVSASVRRSVNTYLDFIETADWPAMAEGRANLRREPPGLPDAITTLLSFIPATPGQTFAQQRAVASIEQALAARRQRILLSKAAIAPIQWAVVVVLALLILLTIAMVHIDRRITLALNLLIYATSVAACLTLLMVNDRPFSAGGNTVRPTALLEIRSNE
jgi:hypothetical protein